MTARAMSTDQASLQADKFRLAMRAAAASVAIVSATDSKGQAQAMTVTSLTSLSLQPASLLVCVNHWALVNKAIADSQAFCINILLRSQQDIAQQCAQKITDETYLSRSPWSNAGNLPPHLENCQANIFCKLESSIEHSTHSIFIGQVVDVRQHNAIDPLIYLNGEYQTKGV